MNPRVIRSSLNPVTSKAFSLLEVLNASEYHMVEEMYRRLNPITTWITGLSACYKVIVS